MNTGLCLTGPLFDLSGDALYITRDVAFTIHFAQPEEISTVLLYEWYLNGLLVKNYNSPGFTRKVPCGPGTIGVRILTAQGWSGIKTLHFETCPETFLIDGADVIEEGSPAEYRVLAAFISGLTLDITGDYVLSASEGSFTGNQLTIPVTENGTRDITLNASKNLFPTLTKTVQVRHTWYNVELSHSFSKRDCEVGSTGTTLNYVVQAGKYSSFVSQEIANQLALNELINKGQSDADKFGQCLIPATINYLLTEQGGPYVYVDSNLQIKKEGDVVLDIYNNEDGILKIDAGHQFTAQVYAVYESVAPNPTLSMVVKKNSVIVYSQTIPVQSLTTNPEAFLLFTDFTSSGDIYDIAVHGYSAATINYTLAEHTDPYADANIQLRSNDIDVLDVYSNSSGSVFVGYGSLLEFIAYALLSSQGSNPMINMTVKKDGMVVFNQSSTGYPGDTIKYTETVHPGSIYEVIVSSTADSAAEQVFSYTRTGAFSKNNCQSGVGTSVLYSKTYYSNASPEDAQFQAVNDDNFKVLGQYHANAYGTCSVTVGTVIEDNLDLMPFLWSGMTGYGNLFSYNMQILLYAGSDQYSTNTVFMPETLANPVSNIVTNPVNAAIADAYVMAISWNSGPINGNILDGSNKNAGVRSISTFVNVKKVLEDYPSLNHFYYEVSLNRQSGSNFQRTLNIGATYDKAGENSAFFTNFMPDGYANGKLVDQFMNTEAETFSIRFHLYKQSATTGKLTYEIL